MPAVLFCPNCGTPLSDIGSACSACGAVLDLNERATASTSPLNKRYHLIAKIGKGGYGAVYKALDTQVHNRTVAIKQINLKGLSAEEIIDATDTFNREARLLSSLRHRQLPRIYDQFSERDAWYLVMDYIEGETLWNYLGVRQGGGRVLPVSEALTIAIELCDVLDYLHTRRPPIIFRDLKPGNIMRTPEGQLYLIDFGIARLFKPEQKRDTAFLGSPGYAAPEQYGKAQTTPQTDIYSLGALLHQMLSGHNPSAQPLTFASLHLESVPGGVELAALIRRMLAAEVSERPPSAREVAATLTHIRQVQEQSSMTRWPVHPAQNRPSWEQGTAPPPALPHHSQPYIPYPPQQQRGSGQQPVYGPPGYHLHAGPPPPPQPHLPPTFPPAAPPHSASESRFTRLVARWLAHRTRQQNRM